MGKFRSKIKGKTKGKRWQKGQSSNSNPKSQKYREMAKSRFFQENLGLYFLFLVRRRIQSPSDRLLTKYYHEYTSKTPKKNCNLNSKTKLIFIYVQKFTPSSLFVYGVVTCKFHIYIIKFQEALV